MIRQPSCVIAMAGFVPQGSAPGKERSFAMPAGTGAETFGLPPGASIPMFSPSAIGVMASSSV